MPLKKTDSNEFLSSSALDYYRRFANNRGIEKFFRNSRMNRASSDSNLNENNDGQETQNIESELAKSLTNLKVSDCEIENKSHETTFRSEATSCSDEDTDSSKEEVVVKKVKPTKQEKSVAIGTKPHSKESSTMTDAQAESTTDKNMNLNLQSKIEITLPPQLQQSMDIPPITTKQIQHEQSQTFPSQVPQYYPPPNPKILYCAETQTTAVSEVEIHDEPIKPNVKLNVSSGKPDDLESSPNESVTSREQRLEWDSLGDVGYQPFLICDKSALSSTERKAIKSYLFKRGLTSTENIIVFKNSPGKQDVSPKSKNRPDRRRSLTYNDNWMEVYTKYKDKYSSDAPKTITKSFKPEAQSTPFDPQIPAISTRFVEKSAQTSLINLLCKSIQVETSACQTKDGSSASSDVVLPESLAKLSVKNPEDDTNQTDFSMETGSFVFITGSPKKNKDDSKHSSPKRVSKKDSNAAKKLNPKRKKSLVSVFEAQTQNNLKVSTLKSTTGPSETSQKSSSTDDSTFKDKEKSSFDEELKMAIALMSSVVESKTMHNEMKKSLINKLMQRIVGLKITSQEQSKVASSHDDNTEVKEKSSSATSIPSDTSGGTEKHVSSAKETTEDTSSSNKSEKSDKIASTVKSQVCSKDSDTEYKLVPEKIALVEDFVKQTLKPMTHSEVDYENHKVSSTHTSASSDKFASKESSSTVSDNRDSMSKKVGQLLTIEKEIERLIKMKELVQFDLKKRKASVEKIYENVDDVKAQIQKRDRSSSRSEKNIKRNERSKLSTPTLFEQNLTNDLLQRKEKFVELYENQRGKLYEVPGPSEVIYTKPYGTKESNRSEAKTVVLSEKYGTRSRQGTSTVSSEAAISSRSISLPMGGNTITNTSTHQYDIERLPNQYTNAVETQTTDSLKRALPFFESKPRIIKNAKRTQIVDKTKLNKQIQTNCPEPVAYSIVFDNVKERTTNERKYSENNQREKEVDDDYDVDTRTLKEHLNDKRPRVRQTMDQRNECIKELRRLRQLRNEQRKKLLLLTSETSLKEKIRHLPPSPLAQKRLFSTRALKLHSLKQYQNLPEVQRKKEVEMVKNLKKKNRFLLDLFNKNLQRKVLKGQTDVSYSVNLFNG